MKPKKKLTIALCSIGIIAIIIMVVVLITASPNNTYTDPLNNMVAAVKNEDFNAYLETLHPALRQEINDLTSLEKITYMKTIKETLLQEYQSGTTVSGIIYYEERCDTSAIALLKQSYKEIGFTIQVQDAYTIYYYSVLLPSGVPDGLDSITVAQTDGKWYLLP